MTYIPHYSEGELIVSFNKGLEDEFAKGFGETLGYKMVEEAMCGGAYVFAVPLGKEQEAKEKFENYKEFVKWTERRDLKMEHRWETLEEVIDELRVLHDEADLPDTAYNQRIADIQKQLQEFKDK